MLGKNIKYYRQMARLSQEELAKRLGMQKMTISHYESDKRMPDSSTIQQIAAILNVKSMDLLVQQQDDLQICHGSFRKQSSMGKGAQDLLKERIARYLERFYDIVGILGTAVLPSAPEIQPTMFSDIEKGGQHLRSMLKLPASGPVGNIVDILENNGFVVCQIDVEGSIFSGINGVVEGRPYIAVNSSMTAERQRFTLVHELAHIAFRFVNDEEKSVDGIAGAFLLPENDAIRELGTERRALREDMRYIQREYGISMACIAMRALQVGIISAQAYRNTQIWLSTSGLRKDEQSGLESEKSHLFDQLVVRAILEEEIGIQKGAELLQKPYDAVRALCYGEVCGCT